MAIDTHFRKRWQTAKEKAKGVKLPSKDLGAAFDKFEIAVYKLKQLTDSYLQVKRAVDEKTWEGMKKDVHEELKRLDPLVAVYYKAIRSQQAALQKPGAKAPPGVTEKICDTLARELSTILQDCKQTITTGLTAHGKLEDVFEKIDGFVKECDAMIKYLQAALKKRLGELAEHEKFLRELAAKVDQLEHTGPDRERANALFKSYRDISVDAKPLLLDPTEGNIKAIEVQREMMKKYLAAEKLKPALHTLDSLEKEFLKVFDKNKPLVKLWQDLDKRLQALRGQR